MIPANNLDSQHSSDLGNLRKSRLQKQTLIKKPSLSTSFIPSVSDAGAGIGQCTFQFKVDGKKKRGFKVGFSYLHQPVVDLTVGIMFFVDPVFFFGLVIC